MTEKPELATALEALAAEPGDGLGAPNPEDVLAWVEGRLAPEDAAWVARQVESDPELALLADDMASFLAGRPLAQEPFLSPEEKASGWAAVAPPVEVAPSVSRRLSPRTLWLRRAFAVAAGLAVVALGARWQQQESLRRFGEPMPNALLLVDPVESARGVGGKPQEVPLPPGPAVHVLRLRLIHRPEREELRLEIRRAGQTASPPLWAADGVRLEEGETVSLRLGGNYLPPGAYEIVLLERDASTTREIEHYRLIVPPR